jgi:hypothetical protein
VLGTVTQVDPTHTDAGGGGGGDEGGGDEGGGGGLVVVVVDEGEGRVVRGDDPETFP